MRIAEAGRRGPVICKIAQILHHARKCLAQMAQCVAVEDEIGVVGDVATRRAQVDDTLCAGSHLAEAIDVRHHVVADLFFPGGDHVVVDGGDIGGKLIDLRLRHRQAKRMLHTRQTDP